MWTDIWTVMWKEWKEYFPRRFSAPSGGRGAGGGWLGLAVFLGVFGVVMPLQFGPEWVTSPGMLAPWMWVPLFLASSVTADSFAGERERHTLETLLASRLPDAAILLGKVLAAVAYAWSFTVLALLLALITANIRVGGELVFYPGYVAAGALVLMPLAAGVIAGAGVLVSLRAATVRQAAQLMSLVVVALVWLPVLGFRWLPASTRSAWLGAMAAAGPRNLILLACGVLATLNAILLALASGRFRRSRLIF